MLSSGNALYDPVPVTTAQLAFTYVPVMNEMFDTRPLSLLDGVAIMLVGLVLFLALEGEKLLMRKLDLFEELRS